ncbi:unnamed protein product [Closterium sp. NIES-64]|nr:unnamed protein product [Closterium sp. NIES-64]
MATSAVGFKPREDHKKAKELEEARKAGLVPAEVDEDGKEINPHIPQYMSSAPWYLNADRPSLKHQRNWKAEGGQQNKNWYDRGAKVFQATKYRKGACTNGAMTHHHKSCTQRPRKLGAKYTSQGIAADEKVESFELDFDGKRAGWPAERARPFCGAMTHDHKSCTERPRKLGAKFTSQWIAADEKVESFDLDFDGKRDRWNGFDPSTYARVVAAHGVREEARRRFRKEQQLRRLSSEGGAAGGAGEAGDGGEGGEGEGKGGGEEERDEARVDESEQRDFAKVEKRVRTTGGGSSGTVRNLRIREDTAKYLLNLDVNSAYYDPKTRSMREDPNPGCDADEKFYKGDNFNRISGQAVEFRQLALHAARANEAARDARGEVHVQGAPSQAELLHREFKVRKERLLAAKREAVREKYGNAAADPEANGVTGALLLGQTETAVEYDRSGRAVKGQEKLVVARSRYEEDVYVNNHTSVWGSYWKDGQWGYSCCHQMLRLSYCTGSAGIQAAEAAAEASTAAGLAGALGDDRRGFEGGKEGGEGGGDGSSGKAAAAGGGVVLPWGSAGGEDVDPSTLDPEKLKQAAKKMELRAMEEKDERKRKYNVRHDDEVTAEDMEVYRLKRVHYDDPMKDYADKE